jgi:hypothetical protein
VGPDTFPISRESYAALQAGLRDLKARGREGWCTGRMFEADGRGEAYNGTARACASGCIQLADPRRTIQGTSPAVAEISNARRALGLPIIAHVNDGYGHFQGRTGYEGAIALLEHLVRVCQPDPEISAERLDQLGRDIMAVAEYHAQLTEAMYAQKEALHLVVAGHTGDAIRVLEEGIAQLEYDLGLTDKEPA